MMDPTRFQALAIETLRQEVPEDLEWVPWRAVPAMRWRADGAPVDERVPRGWLALAARRGEPAPDTDQRQGAMLFAIDTAADLAVWLLRVWIEHDTAVPELSAARREELRGIADRGAAMAQRFGRAGSDPEERYRQLLAQEGNRLPPTALPHQGLLAVVAVCAGTASAEIATQVEDYLRAWHGERPEQCGALLWMLSWVAAPVASEVLERALELPEIAGVARASMAARQVREGAA